MLVSLHYYLHMLFVQVLIFLTFFVFFQAEDGIRDGHVTGVQTCALPILRCVETSQHDPELMLEPLVGVDAKVSGLANKRGTLAEGDVSVLDGVAVGISFG